MKLGIKSYSSSSSLISSIIFFLLGAILFTKPDAVVSFISYIAGGILVMISFVKILIYWRLAKNDFPKPPGYLYFALVLLALGIVFIFFANIITTAIKFILGAWILYSGVNRLIFAIKMSLKKQKGLTIFILAILLIMLGLYVMLVPNLLVKTIGLIIMLYSGLDILGFIFYSTHRQTVTPQEGDTTLIIPEKIKKEKKEKVKKKKTLVK